MILDQMNPPLRGALVGCIAVGGTATLIVAFAIAPAAGVPAPAIGMFGLLGGVLGIVAGAVAGASESNARQAATLEAERPSESEHRYPD